MKPSFPIPVPNYVQYELRKAAWVAAHPEATHEHYERAIRQIAEECGL